ncbi:MAG: hypothetical protein IID31_14025, partial [Planctomycetes bacterium]|nr:hypothetical protein [Planctomycetota bacterium]
MKLAIAVLAACLSAATLHAQATQPAQVAAAAAPPRNIILIIGDGMGTSHIAAASQCPVLLVSVGYVHFRETGPYGDGHIAVESARKLPLTQEPQTITPEQIHAIAQWRLRLKEGNDPQQLPNLPAMDGIDVYLSAMAPDGCLQWRPIIRRAITETDFLRMAYRFMWLDILGALETPEAEEKSIAALLNSFDHKKETDIASWADHHSEIFQGLAQLAQEGITV